MLHNAQYISLGIFVLLLVGMLTAFAKAAENGPWPADIPGFVTPKSGEHPRLLFRKSDLPALRERAKAKEGQQLIKRLEDLLGLSVDSIMDDLMSNEELLGSGKKPAPKVRGAKSTQKKIFTVAHIAGCGMLYQLTGEQRYADEGKKFMDRTLAGENDNDTRYGFMGPNGALRAGPSLGWTALGYDLCYDGWPEKYRNDVANAIETYNRSEHAELEALTYGKRHMPGSNHWGMQVGGAAMALLAIRGDPGVKDPARIERFIEASQKAMIRNLTEGWGDHGTFAEGDGTGVMSSHIVFLPALQAWRVCAGKDFTTPRTHARWMIMKFVMHTLVSGGVPTYPLRGGYGHNVWSRTGMSGPGTFCSGFGIVNEEEKPALMWLYHYALKAIDDKNKTPFETGCEYPHRTILSLVNWPFGLAPENPENILPKLVVDRWSGHCMFRNRWKDGDDILVSAQLKKVHGYMSVGSGPIFAWGLGKKYTLPVTMAGEPTVIEPNPHGGVVSTANQSLLVDFSGKCGSDGLIVVLGDQPARNENEADDAEISAKPPEDDGEAKSATPSIVQNRAQMQAVTLAGKPCYVLTFQKGPAPEARVEGNTLIVGPRKITFDGKKLIAGE